MSVLICLMAGFNLQAQQSADGKLDSLKRVLGTSELDSIRIAAAEEISWLYEDEAFNKDSLFYYTKLWLDLETKGPDDYGKVLSHLAMSTRLMYLNNADTVEASLLVTEQILKRINSKELRYDSLLANVYLQQGRVEYFRDNSLGAFNYYVKSYNLLPHPANALQIASWCSKFGDLELAESYYQKLINDPAVPDNFKGEAWLNLAITKFEQNDEEILGHLKEAEEIFQNVNSANNLVLVNRRYSGYYQLKEDTVRALDYLHKALDLTVEHNLKAQESVVMMNGAKLLIPSDLDSARALAEKALEVQESIGRPLSIFSVKVLYEIYSKQGDEAAQAKIFDLYQERINRENDNKNQEAILIAAYEEQKRQQLALYKSEMELESQRSPYVYWLLMLMVLIIAIAVVVYYRLKKQQSAELATLQHEMNKLQEKSSVMEVAIKEKGLIDVSLNKEKLESVVAARLNETDLGILEELVKAPMLSNRQLADKVFLTQDGVKASLRKMYSLLKIQTDRNKKIVLVREVVKILAN